MNALPIFDCPPIDKDTPLEPGHKVFEVILFDSFHGGKSSYYIHHAYMTDIRGEDGAPLLRNEHGTNYYSMSKGEWYDAEWKVHLRVAELLVKRKDQLMDQIAEAMGTAKALRDCSDTQTEAEVTQ